MKKEILNNLMLKLNNFSENQKLAIGIALCERMLPFYENFAKKYNFGNVIILKNTIQQLKKGISREEINFFMQQIDKIMPDMDHFSGILLATAALDTCAAFYELLLWIQNKKDEQLRIIFSLALNANEMYVANLTEKPFENLLIQTEIDLFNDWIKQITQHKPIEIPKNEWVEKMMVVD